MIRKILQQSWIYKILDYFLKSDQKKALLKRCLIKGLWKNFGNHLFYILVWFCADGAVKYGKGSIEVFAFNITLNMFWFIPMMIILFTIREIGIERKLLN